MSQFQIVDELPSDVERPPELTTNNQNGDSSGFGLVNWLFDHIKDRRPVFLSLFRQYDEEAKLTADYKVLGYLLLFIALIFDLIVFLIYAVAVMLVIVGITFIFVKGTGLLDYVQSL